MILARIDYDSGKQERDSSYSDTQNRIHVLQMNWTAYNYRHALLEARAAYTAIRLRPKSC